LCRSDLSSVSLFLLFLYRAPRHLHSFPTRRSSDLTWVCHAVVLSLPHSTVRTAGTCQAGPTGPASAAPRQVGEAVTEALVEQARSEEHTSELQSRFDLVCRLLLEKKNNNETLILKH